MTSYTSSESSSEEEEKSTDDVVTLKRKREDDGMSLKMRKKKDLPLPSCFQTKGRERSFCLLATRTHQTLLYLSVKTDQSVDIDGKVRNFPHVEGNWPSHIYVKGKIRHTRSTVFFLFLKSRPSRPQFPRNL